MTSDAEASLSEQWATVEEWRRQAGRGVVTAFAMGHVTTYLRDLAFSSLLLLACSALENALEQLAEEGCFSPKSRKLGAMLAASKNALPWEDHQLVTEAKNARNALAHRFEIPSRAKVTIYVDAIREELRAWELIGDDAPAS